MSLFKKKTLKLEYDKENLEPVIRASICTGEQIAGFRDKRTGKFQEIMLIKNQEDRNKFLEQYDLEASSVKKEY